MYSSAYGLHISSEARASLPQPVQALGDICVMKSVPSYPRAILITPRTYSLLKPIDSPTSLAFLTFATQHIQSLSNHLHYVRWSVVISNKNYGGSIDVLSIAVKTASEWKLTENEMVPF